VLGRMAGIAEPEIESLWSAGKRDDVLAKFQLGPVKPSPKSGAKP